MQLRGEPDLGVDDAVIRQVGRAFGGDPDQRLAGLHDRDRVREPLQVQLQVPAGGVRGEPPGELPGIGAGQPPIPGLAGQFHDGSRPQAAIEVIVQHDLGHLAQLLQVRHRAQAGSRAWCASGRAGAPHGAGVPGGSGQG